MQELYAKLGSRDKRLEEIRRENESLRAEMTKLREKNTMANAFKVDEFTEAQTRGKYIDIELIDAICKVLSTLMEKGLKVEGGDKLGKTIIFAKNSPHAKAIVDCFQKYYPEYGSDFIRQIDYSISYADTLIDDFSTKDRLPKLFQILADDRTGNPALQGFIRAGDG